MILKPLKPAVTQIRHAGWGSLKSLLPRSAKKSKGIFTSFRRWGLSLFPEDGSPELFSRSSVRQNNWSCSVIQTNKLLGYFTEKTGVGAKFDRQNRHYQSYCANRVEIYTYVASCISLYSDMSDQKHEKFSWKRRSGPPLPEVFLNFETWIKLKNDG